jgi:hypothetical protein
MKKLTGLLVLCICGQMGNPVLSHQLSRPDSPPGLVIQKIRWDSLMAFTEDESSSLKKAPITNPNRLALPTQGTASTLVRTQLYVYSMELTNNGRKPIRAVLWDFIFLDAGNRAAAGRHTLANLQQINLQERKTLRFTARAAPPRVVSAQGLKKDQRSPFVLNISIRCVLFTDGSTWEQPNSSEACKSLLSWIERRKEHRSTVEDLPLKN